MNINFDDFNDNLFNNETIIKILKIARNQNNISDTVQLKSNINIENFLRDISSIFFDLKFIVNVDNDDISSMSPGKKALVLLKLLIGLSNTKCPILIDQPEDDLDNRSIFEDLVKYIKSKKSERQFIIATHNANILLGADAEQVIVANQDGKNSKNEIYRFEYKAGAIENTSKEKDSELTLDKIGIQEHICSVLEGGKEAFEKRKNKYFDIK